ncbi:MAG: hypothetical protein M1829_005555 [Trizodia sp. TS-e1964]|nr:MAG: hypothetical protein M1829_005555 [Trizodia sp. TS-e1964]
MSVAAAIPSDLAFQARSLYRALLRQSRQFAAYNFREYALRRTQDSFREHKNAAGKQIEELLHQGWADVRMLRVSCYCPSKKMGRA